MIELNMAEEEAFFEHLHDDEGVDLAAHFLAGGDYPTYVQQWKTARDKAAAANQAASHADGLRVLELPLAAGCYWTPDGPDGPVGSVREYLIALLSQLWADEADAKYGMVGEDDWRYDLYEPLCIAGLIPGWRQGYGIGVRTDGTVCSEDREHADALIGAAIHALLVQA